MIELLTAYPVILKFHCPSIHYLLTLDRLCTSYRFVAIEFSMVRVVLLLDCKFHSYSKLLPDQYQCNRISGGSSYHAVFYFSKSILSSVPTGDLFTVMAAARTKRYNTKRNNFSIFIFSFGIDFVVRDDGIVARHTNRSSIHRSLERD